MPHPSHGEGEAEASILAALGWTFVLTLSVLTIEAVGAFLSRSLTLTTDAFHNVPDLVAFAISWWALAATARGATPGHTFGLHRTEVFAALANACLVFATGLFFALEAGQSLLSHRSILGTVDPLWILVAAAPTLVLRIASAGIVGRIPRAARDLNLRSVLIHLLSDVAITVGLLASAAVILTYPVLTWADPLAALFVAGVLVAESGPLFRDSWVSLSEQVPRNISLAAIEKTAASVPHIQGLHDIHVWSICSSLICMTAHVRTENVSVREAMRVVAELRGRLEREYGIVHAVFEVEACTPGAHLHLSPEVCEDLGPG